MGQLLYEALEQLKQAVQKETKEELDVILKNINQRLTNAQNLVWALTYMQGGSVTIPKDVIKEAEKEESSIRYDAGEDSTIVVKAHQLKVCSS